MGKKDPLSRLSRGAKPGFNKKSVCVSTLYFDIDTRTHTFSTLKMPWTAWTAWTRFKMRDRISSTGTRKYVLIGRHEKAPDCSEA